MRGRGGCVGRGRGRRSIAPPLPLVPDPPPVETHAEGMALKFFVKLRGPIRSRLCLLGPFARVMEEEKPPVLWLQAHGCCNGVVEVDMEYAEPRFLLLGRGRKSFAHAHKLWGGHVLRFKMVVVDLLSVKIYGSLGVRLTCCEESSSGTESPSSRDSDEEDSDGSGSDDWSGPR